MLFVPRSSYIFKLRLHRFPTTPIVRPLSESLVDSLHGLLAVANMSFSMSHTVTLTHPISIVFATLSDAQQLERLTPQAQRFSLLPSDFVQLPGGLSPFFTPGVPSNVNNIPRPRTMDKFEVSEVESTGETVLERAWFRFGGPIPLLFGLINSPYEVEVHRSSIQKLVSYSMKALLRLLGSR